MAETIYIRLERDGQTVVNRQIQDAKIAALEAAVNYIQSREEDDNSTPGIFVLRYLQTHLTELETNFRRDEAQRAEEPDDQLIEDVP